MLNRELDVAFVEMDALARALLGGRRTTGWRDTSDFVDDGAAFTWTTPLPGLRTDDVHVTVDDGVLQVEASRPTPQIDGLKAVHRERQAFRLQRRWRLPDAVDPHSVTARLVDGVLTVRLAKRAEVLPRRIQVQG